MTGFVLVGVQTIVTGAGDETLRFWNVFPPPKVQVKTTSLFFLLFFKYNKESCGLLFGAFLESQQSCFLMSMY